MLQQLAHLMMARHLTSLVWPEERYSDDDDDNDDDNTLHISILELQAL